MNFSVHFESGYAQLCVGCCAKLFATGICPSVVPLQPEDRPLRLGTFQKAVPVHAEAFDSVACYGRGGRS